MKLSYFAIYMKLTQYYKSTICQLKKETAIVMFIDHKLISHCLLIFIKISYILSNLYCINSKHSLSFFF